MTPCTGGWCAIRETCQNYTMGGAKTDVRLCVNGKDGTLKDGTPRSESKSWVLQHYKSKETT